MFENSYVLMGSDGGDSGGGGGDDRGFFERGPVVSVSERSFQSPNTTGAPISRDDTFLRGESSADRVASNVAAGLIGAFSPIPGTGTFLASQQRRTTFDTDAQGNVINQGLSPFERSLAADSAGDRQRQFQTFGGFGGPGGSSNTGGRNVASAADIAINRALGFTQAGEARALESIRPFAETGRLALDRESAFLGLQGEEAEQAALAGFIQSPGAQFAQQEEEQAIVRNALALGDAGGGRVKDELATRASGRFGQRLDTRLLQLGRLSGSGQSAAFGEAGIQQEAGANQAQAVLGQQVASATAASEANRISAQERAQKSQQDAAFQSQLFGLGASIAKPFISSFF